MSCVYTNMKTLYNRYFPTPSYLAMNSFALDISDRSIKYGELVPAVHGLRLGRFGKIAIPPDVIVSGDIKDEQALTRILESLKKKEGMHFVRVSLPEEQMYLFSLTLPQVEDIDLRHGIELQLEEHVPISGRDIRFDYQVVKEDENGISVEVIAIATCVIESYISALRNAGLTPLSFELEAEALTRAVVPHDEKGSCMIIDFGNMRTGISIVSSGHVFLSTTLDMGGETLTHMIAKNFDISEEKAEEMKRAYGSSSVFDPSSDMFPIIINGISVLRDEITKQYVYWQTHESNNGTKSSPMKIILCGEGSNLSGLAEYLEASMKMSVVQANPWVNISRMEISVPEMSFQESLGYATVLGLALADYLYD